MKLIGDMHTHTLASGHAYGTIREMAQAAAEQGLEILGLTEHAPGIPGTTDPFYYVNFEVIPRSLFGVRLLHGYEINVLSDGSLSLDKEYRDKLDYAIVGIHLQCYTEQGIEKNTENLISSMRDGKIRLVSHPDDSTVPLDYRTLVRAAAETHTALEVNNSSLVKKDRRIGCYENYRTMLALCRREGVPVIVNSDAHNPSQVGRFQLAEALLHELDFPEELILNTDAQRLIQFLTEPLCPGKLGLPPA